MDVVDALKAENQSLKEVLELTSAEKLALDQYCMTNIQENVKNRARLFLLENQLRKKDAEILELKEKLNTHEKPTLEVVPETDVA